MPRFPPGLGRFTYLPAYLHPIALRARLRHKTVVHKTVVVVALGGETMLVHAYKHARLMEESEARVEMAARFDSPADMLVASRLLENPGAIRVWGGEDACFMG